MSLHPVIIIGGGLSGLCCARQLHSAGIDFLLLEAGETLGGRVRTDHVHGFQLDHGFQALQTAYPEARRQLDYAALKLAPFEPGALIQTGGKVVCISDPWRRPGKAWTTMASGIGSLADRWRLVKLRYQVTSCAEEALWEGEDSTTEAFLRAKVGLSRDMLERFFRPWFSGVFFEDQLATSSKFFRFVFRMFALGDVALPAGGMGEIPRQLAASLPAERVRLASRVDTIEGQAVRLASGESLSARAVVLAVEGPEAARLSLGRVAAPSSCATTCLYFAAPESPLGKPYLLLNGDRTGPINHLCVPSDVAPSYAPAGQALVCASLLGPSGKSAGARADLESEVRRQLSEWFGGQVERWEYLRDYSIPHALPGQAAPAWKRGSVGPRLAEGLYCCGDYCDSASIQGAMLSGRKTAEAVTEDLKSDRGA